MRGVRDGVHRLSAGAVRSGHLTSPLLRRQSSGRGWALTGSICLLSGVPLSSGPLVRSLDDVLARLPAPPSGIGSDPFHLRYTVAALLVFYGVTLLPIAQTALTLPVARWLGKLSFSLYLIHFPILFTVVSAMFLYIHAELPYGAAIAACTAIGMSLTLMLAVLFQRLVDRRAIFLSRFQLGQVTDRRPPSAIQVDRG